MNLDTGPVSLKGDVGCTLPLSYCCGCLEMYPFSYGTLGASLKLDTKIPIIVKQLVINDINMH